MASLALMALLAAPFACHLAPCKAPGFSEGERFQITVLAASTGQCTVAPLAPGVSFILTGGATLQDADLCTVRGATPDVPSFAEAVLTSCSESMIQLGLDCMGMIGASCAVSAQLRLGPYIQGGTSVIDNGVFSILWTGSACVPGGCTDRYDVRINRLPPGP